MTIQHEDERARFAAMSGLEQEIFLRKRLQEWLPGYGGELYRDALRDIIPMVQQAHGDLVERLDAYERMFVGEAEGNKMHAADAYYEIADMLKVPHNGSVVAAVRSLLPQQMSEANMAELLKKSHDDWWDGKVNLSDKRLNIHQYQAKLFAAQKKGEK